MASAASENLNTSENYTNIVEVSRFYCRFRWCQQGPFTKAALVAHLTKHKRPALARLLANIIINDMESSS